MDWLTQVKIPAAFTLEPHAQRVIMNLSLSLSGLLSTWMAFSPQQTLPGDERWQPCTLDLCSTSLINQQKENLNIPVISCKISRLCCIISYWHDLSHMLLSETVIMVREQVQLAGQEEGVGFILCGWQGCRVGKEVYKGKHSGAISRRRGMYIKTIDVYCTPMPSHSTSTYQV